MAFSGGMRTKPADVVFSHPLLWGSVLAFWAIILLVARRLQTKHPDVWIRTGELRFWNWNLRNFGATFKFIGLSEEYRLLGDNVLVGLVVAARAIIVATAFIYVWYAYHAIYP